MGQAFDRHGNILGEAEGDSFRDVLDKLERMHPTAHEVRIKAMREKVEASERLLLESLKETSESLKETV
jgi:hypothetical protein